MGIFRLAGNFFVCLGGGRKNLTHADRREGGIHKNLTFADGEVQNGKKNADVTNERPLTEN